MSGNCEILIGHSDPCPSHATHVITSGCVHEHVSTRRGCGLHLSQAQQGITACGQCWDAGCGCARVVMAAEPLGVRS